jgi:hypothetical protein
MVDDLHRNPLVLRFWKSARGVAVERGPGFFVDLGLERGLERAVGIVRAEKVGVTHEETFSVVVGVDEPAGYAVGAIAYDFASQAREAIGECVSDDEVHCVLMFQFFGRLCSPVVAGHDPMHELVE